MGLKFTTTTELLELEESNKIIKDLNLYEVGKIQGYTSEDINRLMTFSQIRDEDFDCLLRFQKGYDFFLAQLLEEDKAIIVYDKDYDGTNSGDNMTGLVEALNIEALIDYNYEKEHGLRPELLSRLINNAANFIIIVDSSTNNVSEIRQLVKAGKKILIIDHHPIESEGNYNELRKLEETGAFYLINTHELDHPNYDMSYMSAGMLTYLFGSYVARRFGVGFRPDFGLSAASLLADYCSMENHLNRSLMNRFYSEKKFCDLLLDASYKEINRNTIVFGLAPIINNYIRINQMEEAIKLFKNKNNKPLALLKIGKQIKDETKEQIKELYAKRETIYKGKNLEWINIKREYFKHARNFTGILAGQHSDLNKKNTIVTVENELNQFTGSFRGYAGAKSQFKEQGIYAAGHEEAFGIGINLNSPLIKNKIQTIDFNLNTHTVIKNKANLIEVDIDTMRNNYAVVNQIAIWNEYLGPGVNPLYLTINFDKYPNKEIADFAKVRKYIIDDVTFVTFDTIAVHSGLQVIEPVKNGGVIQFNLVK